MLTAVKYFALRKEINKVNKDAMQKKGCNCKMDSEKCNVLVSNPDSSPAAQNQFSKLQLKPSILLKGKREREFQEYSMSAFFKQYGYHSARMWRISFGWCIVLMALQVTSPPWIWAIAYLRGAICTTQNICLGHSFIITSRRAHARPKRYDGQWAFSSGLRGDQ